jgi:hypothetical protein
MGFFDAPMPLFAAAGRVLGLFLPAWATIGVWGMLGGALGTLLYWRLSP